MAQYVFLYHNTNNHPGMKEAPRRTEGRIRLAGRARARARSDEKQFPPLQQEREKKRSRSMGRRRGAAARFEIGTERPICPVRPRERSNDRTNSNAPCCAARNRDRALALLAPSLHRCCYPDLQIITLKDLIFCSPRFAIETTSAHATKSVRAV